MSTTKTSSAEIFSMDDFAKALDAEAVSFEVGNLVRGKIHSYDSDGVYVDINGKSLAFVPAAEVAADESADLSALLPIGDDQEFLDYSRTKCRRTSYALQAAVTGKICLDASWRNPKQ